jgi:hypothetical protein
MVSIAAPIETVLECSPNMDEVIPMTGDEGLQFKVFTMHAFANNFKDSHKGISVNVGTTSVLPNLEIMPATKAADCGVSSQLCWRSYHNGLAPSMYLLVQEMSRVDRNPLEGSRDNRYEVQMSFLCLVKLCVRILQESDLHEQATQVELMNEVLKLLVTPNECQHIMMEKYFKNSVSTRLYESCQNKSHHVQKILVLLQVKYIGIS